MFFSAAAPLPQWCLLRDGDKTAEGAGLITNDFISRMDLWPWLCALYIEQRCRGHSYGSLLIGKIREDAGSLGYPALYICSALSGYYERCSFKEIASGYHPRGEASKVFFCETGILRLIRKASRYAQH